MMLNCDHWFARRTLLPGLNTLHICSSPSLPFICTYVHTYVHTVLELLMVNICTDVRTYEHTHCRCVQTHVVRSGLCVGERGRGEGGGVHYHGRGSVLTRDVPASAQ